MSKSLQSDSDPEGLTQRKARIEYLTNFAKNEYDNNPDSNEIRTRLDNKMMNSWALSSTTRRDYLNNVMVKLKENYKLDLMPSYSLSKITSKKTAFDHTFRTLREETNGSVNSDLLIERLIKTGFFTEIQARSYLTKMCDIGYVYEPKPGFFDLVN